MKSITLTKDQLKSALCTWEQAHRDGATLSREETLAKPVEQVAEESSDYLWGVFAEVTTKGGANARR